jgi:hypothetical protein
VFLEVTGGFDELRIFVNRKGVVSGESASRVGVGVACGGHLSVSCVGFLLPFEVGFYSWVVAPIG